MTRIARLLAITVAGAATLVAAFLLVLTLLINPNDFRDSIQELAREQANIELRLSGNLDWSFFPVLGFAAETVGVGLAPGAPELATIDSMALGVKLLPLFRQSLQIDAIEISGLRLDLQVDRDGHANWEQEGTAMEDAVVEGAGDSARTQTQRTLPDLNISLLHIGDSQIRYRDAQSGSDYDVDLSLLELRDFRFDQPAGLTLQAAIAGVLAKPLPVTAEASVTLASAGDQLQLVVSALRLATLQAQGRVDLDLAGESLGYRGEWAVDTFNPRQWMSAVGIDAPATRDTTALSSASLSTTFSGNTQAVVFNPLAMSLDQSHLSGSLEIADLSRQAMHFAVLVDQFNVDRYQSPEMASQSPNSSTGGQDDAGLIPVALLKSLEIDGSLQLGRLVMSDIPLNDMRVLVKASAGKLRVDLQQVKLLSGSASGDINLDVRSGEPTIKTDIDLRDIALGGLLSPWVKGDLFTGKTSTQLALTTRGNDMDSLLRAALGQLELRLDEAVIHGLNINELAMTQLRDQLGDFALLYPNYQQKLPSSLKRDTEIKSLLTQWRIENGRLILPEVNSVTGEGALSLAGNIDLLGEAFDFRLGVIPEALQSNKYLGGTAWPVRCRGQWDAPVTSWCRTDGQQFESVLQAAAKNAARDKASGKLAEELGLDKSETADPEESVRERAAEEEDRLRQKAKEAINKKLNKLLER